MLWSHHRCHRGSAVCGRDSCHRCSPPAPRRPAGTCVRCSLRLEKYSSFRGASVCGTSAHPCVSRGHTHAHPSSEGGEGGADSVRAAVKAENGPAAGPCAVTAELAEAGSWLRAPHGHRMK